MKVYLLLCFLFIFSTTSFCQQILLDESFDDWNNQNYSFKDKSGDNNSSGIDLTDVKISNDDRYLYLYFDLNKEINIQENNNLTLFIDIDNNAFTGINKYGIGADLVYFLGSRSGRIYQSSSTYTIFHNNIGLITSPTVTSERFEMSIQRTFSIGNIQFKMSDAIKVILSDEGIAGDRAPDINGGYGFEFDKNKVFVPSMFSLKKEKSEYLRVLSYNVLRDNLFDPSLQQNYRRILKGLSPDIIGFCEIYDRSPEQTAALVESHLPSAGNQKWYSDGTSPDIRVVSRYPIVNRRSINGNGAFLIDLGKSKLVFIVAHLPCCDNELQRQQEVDNIMSFVRGIKFGISPFQTPQNTPIIIVGDMNLVGLRQQQQTFLTGNIADNSSYGPDFKPDWDGTVLEDAIPLTNNMPATFTWYSEFGTYSAGRLDYLIFSGSVVEMKNSFALWSPSLTPEQLLLSGIQKDDVPIASDHVPLIGDFLMPGFSSSTSTEIVKAPFEYKVSNDQLIFNSMLSGQVTITDISGRTIYSIQKTSGIDQIEIDLNFNSGVYILHFSTDREKYNTKFFR